MIDHSAARRAYAKQLLMNGEHPWPRAARAASSVAAFILALLWAAIFAALVAQLFFT